MRIDKLRRVKAADLKAGYMYVKRFRMENEMCPFVVLGKCIAEPRTPFLVAKIQKTFRGEDDVQKLFGNYDLILVDTMTANDFNLYSVAEVAKVIEPTEQAIKSWLVAFTLKGGELWGFDTYKKAAYLGDWTQRQKLPCVKEFEIGGRYVKEPLAYLRQFMNYGVLDMVWIYDGREYGKYIWYEVTFGTYLKNSGNGGKWGKRHEVKLQYRDMVAFQLNEKGYQVSGL
jgi:hypothetical protein